MDKMNCEKVSIANDFVIVKIFSKNLP